MKFDHARRLFLPILEGLIPALTLLHSEWPKLYGVLAILSAIGLNKVYSYKKDMHQGMQILSLKSRPH